MKKVGKAAKLAIIILIFLCFADYFLKHYDTKEYGPEQMDLYVEKMCEIADVPGMSMVIFNDNQESYLNVGYADKSTKTEASGDTQYELASATKAFTALGILLLEQNDALDREDPVNRYLPWFALVYKGKKADVTIEQLLCHTSGIPAWTISVLPVGTENDGGLLEKTVRAVRNVELDHLPGTVHSYATINYDILALIMEQITGIAYEEYIKQNVLEPLGMTNSYFRVDNSKTAQLAQGYRYVLMRAAKYDAPAFYGNTAAGYLVSNTKDLRIWLKAQMGMFEADMTEPLEKLKTAIAESHSYPIETKQNYWAGWNIYDGYICHSGNNPNFSSQVIIDTDESKAVFAVANVCGAAVTATADGVYRMIHGESVKIGLYLDMVSMLDFIGFILCLIELYAGICILKKRENAGKHALMKAAGALLLAMIVVAFPYILHYNYLTLAVWYSPCLRIAIWGAFICLSGYAGTHIKNHIRIQRSGKK
ncbi:MAG: serine hydrolase domain-containing protein [Eubacteriales bacterium]|nr:serine hydrolase domain-containing protein [Eubacteriales bacterium]